MSLKMSKDIANNILFIQVAENKLNTLMLKSRHAPIQINEALTKMAEARMLIIEASEVEASHEDNYE